VGHGLAAAFALFSIMAFALMMGIAMQPAPAPHGAMALLPLRTAMRCADGG